MSSPAIEQLRRLTRYGFGCERVFGAQGELDALYYSRAIPGLREAVIVYSETEALAYRSRDSWDAAHPFTVHPDTLVWRRHGDLVSVIHALLSLPPPRPPTLPAWALRPPS